MKVARFNAEATFVQRTRAQRFFRKPSKPCHVGIHWIAFDECSQMSTHGARVLFISQGFLNHFVLAKLPTSSIRVNKKQTDKCP